MRRIFKWLCTGALLLAAVTCTPHDDNAVVLQPDPPNGSDRLTAVISDLHMGVGRRAGGAWHPMEDFRWADEFALFLQEVDRRGNGRTDLVLLGDTLELWQSLDDKDCIYDNLDYACDEAGAIARVQRVLQGHRDELEALGRFADSGANSVVVVPGNHDAALLFPEVERLVLAAAHSTSGRLTLARSGWWRSADGQVYADHGHQIGKNLNRWDNWPRPFIGPGNRYLRRTWGEQFVQRYYNRFEAKYPIIDNMLDNGVGAVYAMKAEGLAGSVHAIGRFLAFFLSNLSVAQYDDWLGKPGEPPGWNVAAVRAQGDRFIVESFPPGVLRDAAGEAAARGELGLRMEDLTDEEIVALCDQREALRPHTEKPFAIVEPPTSCPRSKLGVIGEALLRRSKMAIMRGYLRDVAKELQRTHPGQAPFAVYLYGHTHTVVGNLDPMAGVDEWRPIAFNSGAWQRTVAPRDLDAMRCGRPEAAMIMEAPEVLPACYSAALVPPYEKTPAVQLKYWTTDKGGALALGDRCPPLPPCR